MRITYHGIIRVAGIIGMVYGLIYGLSDWKSTDHYMTAFSYTVAWLYLTNYLTRS